MVILISCNKPKKTYPLGDNTNLVLIDAKGGGYLLYNPETKERSEEPFDTVYIGKHELIGYQEYMDKKFFYTLDGELFLTNRNDVFACETPKGDYFYLSYTGGDFEWYDEEGEYVGYYKDIEAIELMHTSKKDKDNPFVLYVDEKYYHGK